MSFSLPRKVYVVKRGDDDGDTPIAVYLDKDAAELHVESARAAVTQVNDDWLSRNADSAENAFLSSDFPWDVDTDNDYVVNWSPSYAWEEVVMVCHPDQFMEVQDGVIHVPAAGNEPNLGALYDCAQDMLAELERVLVHLRHAVDPAGYSQARIEALIERVRGVRP